MTKPLKEKSVIDFEDYLDHNEGRLYALLHLNPNRFRVYAPQRGLNWTLMAQSAAGLWVHASEEISSLPSPLRDLNLSFVELKPSDETEGTYKSPGDWADAISYHSKPNGTEAIPTPEGYSQVCVWPATFVRDGQEILAEDYIKRETGCRIKFLERILTLPGQGFSGGRSDIIFTVHNEDISRFSSQRFQFGMRWVEDVLSTFNDGLAPDGSPAIYPKHVLEYITWDANNTGPTTLN